MNAVHRATVLARRRLTPRTVRLTLGGPSLVGLATRPAQDVEILLADGRGRRVKRRYTIRQARPERGEWDIDAVLHAGGGPGSEWAARAEPGSAVEFAGPRGRLRLRPARAHLFVGDEASLPAIAALTEALPAGQVTTAVIEIGSPADRQPVAATRADWLERGERPPGTAELILPAVDRETDAIRYEQVYVLAEARIAGAVRDLVRSKGVRTEQIFTKGYWTADPGVPGPAGRGDHAGRTGRSGGGGFERRGRIGQFGRLARLRRWP